MSRKYTNMLMEMVDEGVIDARVLVIMCVRYMSEADVEDMCRVNGLLPEEEEDVV